MPDRRAVWLADLDAACPDHVEVAVGVQHDLIRVLQPVAGAQVLSIKREDLPAVVLAVQHHTSGSFQKLMLLLKPAQVDHMLYFEFIFQLVNNIFPALQAAVLSHHRV